MAFQFTPPGAEFRTLLWDRRGRPVLVAGYRRYMTGPPGGPQTEISEGNSIQCVDGTVASLSFLGAKDAVPLGVCELCRYPPFSLLKPAAPTHGLCSLPNLHICPCGEPFCPRHGKQCDDEIWRCSECADMWALKQSYRRIGRLLLWPFFRKDEES